MAEEVPSQAKFVGWLAMVLMVVTIGAAVIVLSAANFAPT